MRDYSFIRLLDNFSRAKNLNESPVAEQIFNTQVHLLPFSETYLQITNTPQGIRFQSNYIASLVDCSNNVIEDITKHLFISEFTSYTGLQQIAFEIVNLPTDHGYKILYLRLESATNSNYVFWSSPFIVTEDSKKYTTRHDYWSNYNYKGIDYVNSGFKQSIRLNTFYNQPIDEIDIEAYTQITTGRTVPSRSIIKEYDQYFVENFNGYNLRRLNVLLTHNNVYTDCVQSNYFEPLEFTERIELSNLIETSYLLSLNESDTIEFEFQIYEGVEPISFTPNNSYTTGNLPTAIVVFNQNIIIETGEIKLFNSSNTLLQTWNQNDLSFVGSQSFQINDDLNNYAIANDDYYFFIDNTLIKSTANVFYQGIQNDRETWNFTIGDADFNSTDFNNSDFLT
jgi:hypothetical protein